MKGKKIIMTILIVIGFIVGVEILALLKLKYSVSAYKNYWEKGNTAAVTADDQLYIAMGDSVAQGIGASRPQKGYVGLLEESLTARGDKPVRALNLSVSGARIQDVIDVQLPRLKDLPIESNTIITLDVGANDMLNFDEDTFYRQMDNLISQLPKQTLIADIPYFGGGRHRTVEPKVLKANKIIQELGSKYGVKLAGVHAITKERDNLLVYAADLFHPSNRGYRNWYLAFAQALEL